MCEQPQPVRQYIQHGPGGVHYVMQDGDIVTPDVDGVLDGDIDELLLAKIRRRAEETHCG